MNMQYVLIKMTNDYHHATIKFFVIIYFCLKHRIQGKMEIKIWNLVTIVTRGSLKDILVSD